MRYYVWTICKPNNYKQLWSIISKSQFRNYHKLNVDLSNVGKIKSRRAFLYVLETSNWVSAP